MFGWIYSVRQNFSFTRKELMELFWTSLAFAFIASFRKWGVGDKVNVAVGIGNLLLALLFVIIAMLAHVALQKLVAIKLGYKATYTYWLNGILISVFLGFMSAGYIVFILPGAVMVEHTAQLRLGKFRYGTNLKDIARVALAGPIANILMTMVVGIFYFNAGHSELLFAFIMINLFLAVYSMLPVPKIDFPSKMDSGSDGLAMFYFSRTLYVLVLATVLIYAVLVFAAVNYVGLGWLFIIAFALGCLLSLIYSVSIEQKN